MHWTTPTAIALRMDSEIGSYQDDFDGERPVEFAEVEDSRAHRAQSPNAQDSR